jgi:hypothetical protein
VSGNVEGMRSNSSRRDVGGRTGRPGQESQDWPTLPPTPPSCGVGPGKLSANIMTALLRADAFGKRKELHQPRPDR